MTKSSPELNQEHADLQIGPTDQGMVRLIVLHKGREINMDFDTEEALEIAEEIKAAVKQAQKF